MRTQKNIRAQAMIEYIILALALMSAGLYMMSTNDDQNFVKIVKNRNEKILGRLNQPFP